MFSRLIVENVKIINEINREVITTTIFHANFILEERDERIKFYYFVIKICILKIAVAVP